MTIALVTVTYNAASVWDDFQASLFAQTDADWRLYIIDNASADGTCTRLAAIVDPRVTVVLNDANLGVATANNQGIRLALAGGARRIMLINNDTLFDPDMLGRLDAELTASGADAISPLIPYYDHPDIVWYGGGHFSRYKGVRSAHDHLDQPIQLVGDAPFQTDYAPTCCIMFDPRVFERVGLMDERYFVYWDDTDYLWRMKRAGMKLIVDPRVKLFHKVSISTGGRLSDFSIRYHYRNQIFFARKFHGAFWPAYTALLEFGAGMLAVLRSGETPRHLLLRMKALGEGLTMPCERA